MITTNPARALDRLGYLLQCEISAIATYDRALAEIEDDEAKTTLGDLKAVHEERLKALTSMVKESGGTPPPDPGLWGWIAKWLDRGTALLGKKAIVGALVEYEIKSLADLKSNVEHFDETIHKIVFEVFVPAQQECFERISKLHKSMR